MLESVRPTCKPQTAAEHAMVETYGGLGHVLVTGATGFLGSHVVAALLRVGARVRIVARDPDRVSSAFRKATEVIYGDICDEQVVHEAVKDVSVVINCAAITTNRATWEEHERVNVRATESLFLAAEKAGVKRIVHMSSVVVYGLEAAATGEAIRELSPYAQRPPNWAHYMRSKIESDQCAQRYNAKHTVPVTVLRLGIVYGPGAKHAPGRGLMDVGSFRFMIGMGRNHLPYAYIDNVVDLVLMASAVPQAKGQTYNILDMPQRTVREAVARSRSVTGKPIRVVPIPPFVVRVAAWLLEARATLSGGHQTPKVSRVVIDGMSRDIRYSTCKAEKELGIRQAVDFKEALLRTLGDASYSGTASR